MASISILLHELIKLMYHAKIKDPVFIRVGTCDGFATEPGTVVVTEKVLNNNLESVYELVSTYFSNVYFYKIKRVVSFKFWKNVGMF